MLIYEERWYVNEITRLLKNIDPVVPSSWEVTDGNAATMSASGGGGSVVQHMNYEPNGNLYEVNVTEGSATRTTGAVYDRENRPKSFYLNNSGIITSKYLNNFMNQRVRKSILATLSSRSFVYDLTGNMMREEESGDWSEYVYLGGHR